MCRQRRPDAELTRAGRASDGVWYIGRGDGRGLWWCSTGACVQQLNRGHAQKAIRRGLNDTEAGEFAEFLQGHKMTVVVEE